MSLNKAPWVLKALVILTCSQSHMLHIPNLVHHVYHWYMFIPNSFGRIADFQPGAASFDRAEAAVAATAAAGKSCCPELSRGRA